MTYPEEFLRAIAQQKRLSPGEKEVFLPMFGQGLNQDQIAAKLKTTPGAIATRCTEIYKKFGLGDESGPVKRGLLGEKLAEEYQRYLRQPGIVSETAKAENAEREIGTLVQEVRSRITDKIINDIGKMRMLRVGLVPVEEIYIDLNLLEQPSCDYPFIRQREQLRPDDDKFRDSFERIGSGLVWQKQVPALKVVQSNHTLMVLGKPGAGKTTLLKSLAVQCIRNRLPWQEPPLVPVFLALRTFAEDWRSRLQVWEPMQDLILLRKIQKDLTDLGIENEQLAQRLAREGRLWLLLDGLDEVLKADGRAVVQQIRHFCEQYPKNRVVVTCRTQQQRYRFDSSLRDVEVANFTRSQVKLFINKWFTHKFHKGSAAQAITQAQKVFDQLQQPENKTTAELAVTPILLNLTCSVAYGDEGTLPSDRVELYEKGIRDLLTNWDEERGINRPQQSNLSLDEKEALLSHLAFVLFERNDYIPQLETLKPLISEFLKQSKSQTIATLRSMEADHGLLIERAEGYWSFSHLTFQEYFTAREVVENSAYEQLVVHLTEPRWREIFLLAAGMMNANQLVKQMKLKIDTLLAQDAELQRFLLWVSEKSQSVDTSYKPAAIRAFYFDLARALARALDLDLDLDLALARALARALALDLDLALARTLAPDLTPALTRALDRALALDLARARALALAPDLARALALDLALDRALAPDLALDRALDRALAVEAELQHELQTLSNQLPAVFLEDWKYFEAWWRVNGADWCNKLQTVMIKYRNIGHDWQCTDQQKKLLDQYYDANKLLVDCLNSSRHVSPEVRQEIEDTLLLPIAQIPARNSTNNA